MITFDDVSFAYQGGIPDGSEPPALRHIQFSCGTRRMYRIMRKKRMRENDDAAHGQWPCSSFLQGRLEGDITVGNVHIKEASLPQVAAVAGSVFQNPRTQIFSSGYDRRDGVQYGKFEHPA